MMPPSGTFDYVAIAPADPLSSVWDVTLREPVGIRGDKLHDRRLVGHAPKLRIADVGLRPDTQDWQHLPKVLLSQITLTADREELASVASASFFLDGSVTKALRPGDYLYLSRTGMGRRGISVIRNNSLIVAVGAITTVPLSDSVQAKHPIGLIEEAEAVFKKADSDFEFREYPLEIQLGDQRHIVFKANLEIGDYQVFVTHGLYPGIPGEAECAAISLTGSCSATGAAASADLLNDRTLFNMVSWPCPWHR